eukprot:2246930-Alexandrium_andersonii.AAC.1
MQRHRTERKTSAPIRHRWTMQVSRTLIVYPVGLSVNPRPRREQQVDCFQMAAAGRRTPPFRHR